MQVTDKGGSVWALRHTGLKSLSTSEYPCASKIFMSLAETSTSKGNQNFAGLTRLGREGSARTSIKEPFPDLNEGFERRMIRGR